MVMSERERQKHLSKPAPVRLTGQAGYTPDQVLEYFENYYLEQGQPNDGYRPTRAGNTLTLFRRQTKASQGAGIAGPVGMAVGGMMKTRDGVNIAVTEVPGGSAWTIEGEGTGRLAQRLGFLGTELAKVPLAVGDAPATAEAVRVKCPHCAELILPDARICRFCGRDVVT